VRPAQRLSVVIGAKAKLNLIFKRVCEKAKRLPSPKVRTGQLVLPFLAPPP